MAAFNGKNVLFLQGTQLDLNKMMSNSTDVSKRGTAQEGAFYLTNDTHRLYIGRTAEDGKTYPVAVNEGVVTVESVDKLPSSGVNVGEFYYVTTGNILCVYSGSGFVQINSDTDSNSYITAIDTPTITSNTDGITVSFNILQKDVDKNGDEIADGKHIGSDFTTSVPVSFTIAKSHLDTVLPDNIAVGLDAEAITDGGAKLSTTGAGSDATNIVNLKQGDNITIFVSDDDVTIAADDTQYDLVGVVNTEKGQIQLQAKDGSENDDVYFETGNDALTVASTASGVTYTHKEYETTEGANTATSPDTHKGKFTVIDGITTDKGHVTAWTSKEIELPEDQNTTNVSMTIATTGRNESSDDEGAVNPKGSLKVTLTDSATNTIEAFAADVLYHKITVDGTEATVYNQDSLGSFYSTSKIDELMQGVNAMTYKGTVDKEHELPSTSVKIGDTYKVAEAGSYGTHDCDTGDLLIATGTEVNGTIDTDTLVWTYVPSGDDTDTHYEVEVRAITDVDGAEIVLSNDVTTDEDTIQILGGTTINVIPSAANSTITINHENVTRNDGDKLADETPAHDGTGRVTVVDSVVTNDQGHVTAVKTKDIVIPADANTTYDLAGNNNKIILTAYNGTTSSGSDEITVTDDDKYIEATVTSNELKIAHKSYTAETLSAAASQATELAHGESFTVLTGVTRDDGGHIDGVTSSTWTLPQDQNTTYTMSDHVVSAKTVENGSGATITTTLDGYNGDTKSSTNTANFDITSTSLKIEADATNGVVAVNMVWGSF